jgi:O-antigen ligase
MIHHTLVSRRHMAVVLTSSVLLALVIVFGLHDVLPRIWAALCFLALGVLVLWRLTVSRRISVTLIDQFVWAVLICHTVIIHSPRDIRLLIDSPAPSAEILIQMAVWCVCIMYSVLRLIQQPGRISLLFGRTGKYATIFFLVALTSATYAVGPQVTLAWCLKLLAILLVCCVLFDPSHPSDSCSRFVTGTYLGLVLMLLQFLVVAAITPDQAFDTSSFSNIYRAGGSIMPPTGLSIVSGMAYVLAFIDLLTGRRTRLSFVILIVAGTVMLAALGRGGILAASICTLLLVTLLRRLRLLVAAGVAGALLIFLWPQAIGLTWDLATRRQREEEIWSLNGRVPIWETTLEMISERPLLGWGYVSGSRIGLLRPVNGWLPAATHNAGLEILLCLGVVGAAILLILVVRTLTTVFGFLRDNWDSLKPSSESIASLKVLMLVIFLLIEGLLEGGISGPPRYETTIFLGTVFFADQLRRVGPGASRG